MKAQNKLSAGRRVALLWGLVLAVFLAFSAVFWPLRHHQREVAPENFVRYAQRLYDEGNPKEALSRLQEGIAAFHPPCAEPYALLGAWLKESGKRAPAREAEARSEFYLAVAADAAERPGKLRQAVDMLSSRRSALHLTPSGEQFLLQAGRTFGQRFEVEDTLYDWPPSEQIALFRLAGGVIATDGMAGTTDKKCPQDILAVSCGGPNQSAQIWMRGRDFAGRHRGLHAVLVDTPSGQIIQFGCFDLWDRLDEAVRMTQFLRDAPEGCIGVFAVSDDASANLTPDLERELLAFGLAKQASIRREPALYGLRYSFAAIGVKGAPRGSALQAWSPPAFGDCAGHPVVCAVLRDAGNPS